MPDGAHKGSFVQAYNAQIAVDSERQIIVAADITQQSNDKQQLVSMLDQVKRNAGASPATASADAGYWSPEQVTDERVAGIDLYVATGRDKQGAPTEPVHPSNDADLLRQMKQKLHNEAGRGLGCRCEREIVYVLCRHGARLSSVCVGAVNFQFGVVGSEYRLEQHRRVSDNYSVASL